MITNNSSWAVTLAMLALAVLVPPALVPQVADAQRRQPGARQIYPVPVGASHPDFKLPDVTDGKPISLSDYQGKKVVLVHFASW